MSLTEVIYLAYQEQLLEKITTDLNKTIDEENKMLINFLSLYEPTLKVSFLSKLFKTKKYKATFDEYQRKLKEFNENNQKKAVIKEKYNTLINELENKKIQLSKQIELMKSNKISGIDLEREKFRKSIKFNDLGIPIIDDSDEEKFKKFVNMDITDNFSMDDIMMVHATKYFPKDLIIRTAHDSNVSYNEEDIDTIATRNTLHFALNGKVSSHAYGDWKNMPLVILDPIKHHIDQMACIKDNDSFTYGSMKLSKDAIILIKKERFDDIYQEHKKELDSIKDNIVIFDGDSEIVVQKLLILLGYKPQDIGMWSWNNEKNSKFLEEYVMKNYPNKEVNSHSFTKYSLSEKTLYQRDKMLNSLRKETEDYHNGSVISLEELYMLFTDYKTNYLDQNDEQIYNNFLKYYGIRFHDNEIHILGYKDYLEKYKLNINKYQIEKLILLLKKYEMMQNLERRKNK